MKLQFHGMDIGRTITDNVSCDHKLTKAPAGHLFALLSSDKHSDDEQS